jgi:DNA-binding MarR family transcriptional regulator
MFNNALKRHPVFQISICGIQIKLFFGIHRGMPGMELLSISSASEICQQCTCFNLRKATRAISLMYDRELRPCGLRTTQFLLLTEIKVSAPITIQPLAGKMLMHRTALARNLKLLKKKGLIKIEPGHDRRERMIRLTVRGQKSLNRAYPFWQHAQHEVAQHFGKNQLNHFLSELSELAVTLNIKGS